MKALSILVLLLTLISCSSQHIYKSQYISNNRATELYDKLLVAKLEANLGNSLIIENRSNRPVITFHNFNKGEKIVGYCMVNSNDSKELILSKDIFNNSLSEKQELILFEKALISCLAFNKSDLSFIKEID